MFLELASGGFGRGLTSGARFQRRIRIVDSCGDVFSDAGANPAASIRLTCVSPSANRRFAHGEPAHRGECPERAQRVEGRLAFGEPHVRSWRATDAFHPGSNCRDSRPSVTPSPKCGSLRRSRTAERSTIRRACSGASCTRPREECGPLSATLWARWFRIFRISVRQGLQLRQSGNEGISDRYADWRTAWRRDRVQAGAVTAATFA
jgi:hypothetical protein